MKPSISVIVPTFNRAHLVVRTLDSIAAQTEAPDRLIVVDNNSTDGTMQIVERWMRLYNGPMETTLLMESKPGAAAARDRGLADADTDVVCFFDSDDEMRPAMIKTIRREFEVEPDLELLHWPVFLHPLSGKPRKLKSSPDADMGFQIFHSFLGTQRFAAKRDLIIKVGGWNHNLTSWNDWELGIRLLLTRPFIKGYSNVLADIYAQEKSITGTSFHSNAEKIELAIRHAEAAVKNSRHPERYRFLRLIKMRKAILAGAYFHEGYPLDGQRLLSETIKEAGNLRHSRLTAMLCRVATIQTAVIRRGAAEWARLL